MLYITGIVIAFFLASLLLGKKHKNLADKLLSAWLTVIGLHLLFYYLWFTNQIFQMPWLLGWERPLPLVHGPFLYLYAAALINRLPSNRKLMWLHFLPAVAGYLYLIRFFILDNQQKLFIYQHKGEGFEVFMTITLWSVLLSGCFYTVWTNILLARHRRTILDEFSNTEKINLKWLQYLSFGIAFIWLSVILGTDSLTFMIVVLYVLFMGYFGIRQAGIFTAHHPQAANGSPALPPGHAARESFSETKAHSDALQEASYQLEEQSVQIPDPNRQALVTVSEKKKYSKSGLSEEMAVSLHQELNWLMEREKLYTESELSLSDLAARLSVHPNYLSQLINEKEGKNFYDYINTLRIEEFKRLVALPENQRYTILSLAYECGFNSKSSFNRFFKKATGQSPSVYLRAMEEVQEA